MFKKVVIILTFLLFITSCSKKINKDFLDDKYYNKGQFIEIKSDDIGSLSKNYILYTYNNFCSFPKPCEDVFKEFMEKYKIDFVKISYDEFKKTSLHDTVGYAPSIIIVMDNKIVSYLDAEKDSDIEKYQDVDEFSKWVSTYIYLEKEEISAK